MYADYLKDIQLTNFKSFSDPARFPLRPITLIFGPNSSGKSSFIQALLLLKQSLMHQTKEKLITTGPLVNLGNYKNYIFGHDEKKHFSISFSFDLNEGGEIPLYSFVESVDLSSQYRKKEHSEILLEFLKFLKRFNTIRILISFKPDEQGVNTLTNTMEIFLADEKEPVITYMFENQSKSSQKPNFAHPFWKEYWRTYYKKENNKSILSYAEGLYHSYEDLIEFFEDSNYLSQSRREEYERYLKDCRESKSPIDEFEFFRKDAEEFNQHVQHIKNNLEGFEQAKELFRIEFLDVYPEFLEIISGFVVKDIAGAILPLGEQSRFLNSPEVLFFILTQHIKNILNGFSYMGPFRELPSRHYVFDEVSDELDFKGANMPAILFRNPKLLKQINEDLEFFGQDYQLKVVEYTNTDFGAENIYSLQLINKHTGLWSSFADVGFGFSQLLPMIALLRASEGRTIMIEQPELHLHPAMQAELGDLIINSCLDDETDEIKNSLIIETHSEHLILRILRRIRESSEGVNTSTPSINPENISILYVQPGKAGLQRMRDGNKNENSLPSSKPNDKDDVLYVQLGNNGSEVIHIPVTEDGGFERPWPNGFFAERAKELF